jgi:hypothetical protein
VRFYIKSYDSGNHVYYVRINIIYKLEIQSDKKNKIETTQKEINIIIN